MRDIQYLQGDLQAPPFVEYGHADPLFQRQVAVTGLAVHHGNAIAPQRADLRFGSRPNGEILLLIKHAGVIRVLAPNCDEAQSASQISRAHSHSESQLSLVRRSFQNRTVPS